MTRRQKDPLRAITTEERQELARISRATSESVTRVTCANALGAVAEELSYTSAAQAYGRRSGDTIAQLVERFNREGLAALTPRNGGGAKIQYTGQQRQQMLAVAQQQPELEIDSVSQWSLVTSNYKFGKLRRIHGFSRGRVFKHESKEMLPAFKH